MQIISILDEDIINYKKISMFIAMPYCSGKCWRELGLDCSICQNEALRKELIHYISNNTIVERYNANKLTEAIVFGGMEPLDSFNELIDFIRVFRETCKDDIVIYTGYKKEEILDKLDELAKYSDIIVKFGRYIPNDIKHKDNILGVDLISSNQYAEKIS